jgi:hypothetical protein
MGRKMLVNVVLIKKYSGTSVIPKIIQDPTSVVSIKIQDPTRVVNKIIWNPTSVVTKIIPDTTSVVILNLGPNSDAAVFDAL